MIHRHSCSLGYLRGVYGRRRHFSASPPRTINDKTLKYIANSRDIKNIPEASLAAQALCEKYDNDIAEFSC